MHWYVILLLFLLYRPIILLYDKIDSDLAFLLYSGAAKGVPLPLVIL